MGAACGKDAAPSGAVVVTKSDQDEKKNSSSTSDLGMVMFKRVDRGHKGYLDINDLKHMMADSKAHFQGKDAQHVLSKYGTDNKMSPKEFSSWWNSTYTTYNDDAQIADLVSQVKQENNMASIPEKDDSVEPVPMETTEPPINRS